MESRHFLFAALLGVLIFIAVIFLNNISARIHQGQQGIVAIQLLDAMRRPVLALEAADRENHLDPSALVSAQAKFEQAVTTIQQLSKRYLAASRYNPVLAKNVDELTLHLDNWIQAEQKERKQPHQHPTHIPISQHLFTNHQHLIDVLSLIAEGEPPIHQDIEQGQSAERLLQWSSIVLLSYLFLLFIFLQRFRQRQLEQVQAELQQRENYLSMTLDSIGDAVIATDTQGKITRMNPIAEALTGWQQSEACAHPLPDVFKIINALNRKTVDNPVDKVLSNGQIVGLANHTLLIAKNGCEYQIADSGAPILDEKGKVLGVILVFRDITKEYQQQEILRKSQHQLAEAQQLSHVGNWQLDLLNDRLEWSDEIFRIFEINREQFQPSYEGFLNSIHPDDRERVNQAYSDSLKNKTPYKISHRLLMSDGRIKYVNEYCQTDFDEQGNPLRSIGVVQDISEQRILEDELFKTASEWTQAMDSINDAIYLIDLDDRVIRANKTFYQLTGLKPEQVIGQDINQIMHPEGEPEPCPVCQARKAHEDTLLIMETKHPDNPTGRPIEITLQVIRDTEKVPVSILMKIRDLTQQRETENKLRQHQEHLEIEVKKRTTELTQANKELESFSYSISHDLRAPLRAINGFAIALCEDYAEKLDDTANNYLARISAGANRMSTLIDDLLMLSRINRAPLNRTDCNLGTIANEIKQQFAEQYPSEHLQWKIQQQLNTHCDENLIRIALENLLGNALKYSSNNLNAVIEFGCQQQNGETVFYIRDNGVGFDMQYVSKLFGAFQRLHGKEFEGTGIGLATVQRIISRHGGKIWAEAKVDKGATFYFSLE